jgi:hypothetical protein
MSIERCNQMKAEDWKKYSEETAKSAIAIKVPVDLNPSDIIRIHSEIDELFSEVRVSFGRIKFQHESVKRKLKNAEKAAYAMIKDLPKEDQPKNDKERDAWIVTFLSSNPLPNMKTDIYTVLDIVQERYEFLAGVVDVLAEKTDRMSTMYGCIKLDAELSMGKASRGAERMLKNDYRRPDEPEEKSNELLF